jgi:hypothetical protein
VIGSIFILDLQWDQWWPAILIAVGLGIVVGYALRLRGGDSEGGGEGQGPDAVG